MNHDYFHKERAFYTSGAFSPLRPGFDPSSDRVEFLVDKVVLVFSEYLKFPANLHSTNCSIIYHPTPYSLDAASVIK
jgi:hypothetical protein